LSLLIILAAMLKMAFGEFAFGTSSVYYFGISCSFFIAGHLHINMAFEEQ
jgi:hypothetical protein